VNGKHVPMVLVLTPTLTLPHGISRHSTLYIGSIGELYGIA
jgi:hypothetical protein